MTTPPFTRLPRLPKVTEPLNTVTVAGPLPMDATGLTSPLASLTAQLGPVSLFDDVLTQQQVRACMELGGHVATSSRCVLIVCEVFFCGEVFLVAKSCVFCYLVV